MTHLLIFNCGSSSLSYKLYDSNTLAVVAHGKAYHVATKSQEPSYLLHHHNGSAVRQETPLPSHRAAAQAVLEYLAQAGLETPVIGHRFVHGGVTFQSATPINAETLPRLEACSRLAPIHNPNSLSVIHLCQELRPAALQYASFDTAFHSSLPEHAYRYALPTALADQYGFRKYGFHGLSYQYCCLQAARYLDRPLSDLRLVICHLGTGGSSAVAVRDGESLDTSMGYSPLPGLVMSTRSGDLDPAIVLELIEEHGYTPAQVNRLLNKDSGLVGVSEISSDLFELLAQGRNPRAGLAIDLYVHRLKSYIGAYLALLGGAHALVFTDDIGVCGWQIRELACSGMEWCGLELDLEANQAAPVDQIARLSASASRIAVLSIPTDEEYVIALQGIDLFE